MMSIMIILEDQKGSDLKSAIWHFGLGVCRVLGSSEGQKRPKNGPKLKVYIVAFFSDTLYEKMQNSCDIPLLTLLLLLKRSHNCCSYLS